MINAARSRTSLKCMAALRVIGTNFQASVGERGDNTVSGVRASILKSITKGKLLRARYFASKFILVLFFSRPVYLLPFFISIVSHTIKGDALPLIFWIQDLLRCLNTVLSVNIHNLVTFRENQASYFRDAQKLFLCDTRLR